MKLLVAERDSAAVREVWETSARICSRLLYPEARAALAAAGRAGRIGGADYDGARALLERLWRASDRLGVTPAIARRAGDLAEEHALRGYDALHLASFEAIADADTLLVTFDDELRAAARALGFPTAPAV